MKILEPLSASICKVVQVRSFLLKIYIKKCMKNLKAKESSVSAIKSRQDLAESGKTFGLSNITVLSLISLP